MPSRPAAGVPRPVLWAAVLAWMLLIFLASAWPRGDDPVSQAPFALRKAAHLFEYAVLAILVRRAGLRPWLAWLWAVLYAMTDEWHQTFVPGRDGRWADVAIDAAGAALGLAAARAAALLGRRGAR